MLMNIHSIYLLTSSRNPSWPHFIDQVDSSKAITCTYIQHG